MKELLVIMGITRTRVSAAARAKWRLVAAVMLAGMLPPASALATIYLQEGFNYPVGTLATNSPWTDATSLIVVTNTSLTYSNLADFSPAGQACAVNAGSTALSYRPLTIAPTSGAVYFSCLINFSVKPGSYYIGGLLQATNAPPGGAADDPLDLIDDPSGSGYKLGIRARGGSVYYVTNALTPLNVGTTYAVVMKYNFTNGIATLYVNPSPGGAEPATPDAISTPTAVTPDLSYLYLRSGSTSAGNFLISTLRVGSTWSEVTPPATALNGVLAFATQPTSAMAGKTLPAFSVQLESATGASLASNAVPVSLSISGGSFYSGATNASTGATGLATFNNLIIRQAGTYTLTATASNYTSAISSNFTVLPGAIDQYTITAPATALTGAPFAVSGTAVDSFGNVVTTDSSTVVTLGSNPTNVVFDANGDGSFDDASLTLANGAFTLNALDNNVQTVTVTVSDPHGHTGGSSLINVYSNNITAQGYQLNAFLDSLEVTNYWLVGTSVNWLTGAAGGSGKNMTLGTDSHCSAFAGAVTYLLGVYLLRQPAASDINLANNQAVWFVTNTAGWYPVTSMTNAQALANNGVLVMASYQASSGSGHIAVLRASNRTTADIQANGPEECQSGDSNFADTNIVTGFSEHPGAFPNNIKYYAHSLTYPVSPITAQLAQPAASAGGFTAATTTITGRSYLVQSTTNFVNWITVLSATNSEASTNFFVTGTFSNSISGGAERFYRVLIP